MIGRPRTTFRSVEEERDYLKAQVEYLKKRYPKSTRGGKVPKVNQFAIIDELRQRYRLTWLMEIADVSRSGYYKWRHTQETREAQQRQEQVLKEHIMAIHLSFPPSN